MLSRIQSREYIQQQQKEKKENDTIQQEYKKWMLFIQTEYDEDYYRNATEDKKTDIKSQIESVECEIEKLTNRLNKFTSTESDDDKINLCVISTIKSTLISLRSKLNKLYDQLHYFEKLPSVLTKIIPLFNDKKNIIKTIDEITKKISDEMMQRIKTETAYHRDKLTQIIIDINQTKFECFQCLHCAPDGTRTKSSICELCDHPLRCSS